MLTSAATDHKIVELREHRAKQNASVCLPAQVTLAGNQRTGF
jgi:hypothetical protein